VKSWLESLSFVPFRFMCTKLHVEACATGEASLPIKLHDSSIGFNLVLQVAPTRSILIQIGTYLHSRITPENEWTLQGWELRTQVTTVVGPPIGRNSQGKMYLVWFRGLWINSPTTNMIVFNFLESTSVTLLPAYTPTHIWNLIDIRLTASGNHDSSVDSRKRELPFVEFRRLLKLLKMCARRKLFYPLSSVLTWDH
jgi:hypothetical protein